MPVKKSKDRPWTRKEEELAVSLRRQRHAITYVAKVLGRTYAQVSVKLSRLGVTKKSHHPRRGRGEFEQAMQSLCASRFRTDRQVARLIGSTHQEVFKARKRLGIKPAYPSRVKAMVKQGASKRRLTGLECWGCGSKQGTNDTGWVRTGWQACHSDRVEFAEAYCPKCVPPEFKS